MNVAYACKQALVHGALRKHSLVFSDFKSGKIWGEKERKKEKKMQTLFWRLVARKNFRIYSKL